MTPTTITSAVSLVFGNNTLIIIYSNTIKDKNANEIKNIVIENFTKFSKLIYSIMFFNVSKVLCNPDALTARIIIPNKAINKNNVFIISPIKYFDSSIFFGDKGIILSSKNVFLLNDLTTLPVPK